MTAVLDHERVSDSGRSVLTVGFRGPTFGIVLVVTLLAFESMAVGTVMPLVAGDLDGLALYAWGFSATLITSLLSTVLVTGWVDRSGPSRPFMIGLGTFVAGLVVAGAATSMWVFVAGRAVQGLGTGVSLVAMYVVIARVYPEELRSRVFAALSAAWVLPSLIGPAVGGVVAEHIGWRWVFLGLIPWSSRRRCCWRRGARHQAGRHRPRSRQVAIFRRRCRGGGRQRPPLRLRRLALDDAARRPGRAREPGLRAAAAAARRDAAAAPRAAERHPRPGMLSGAFFGAEVFIPLALTRLHHFSATRAGIVLTVGALGWSAASQIQGRSKRPREFYALLGAVLVTAGIVLATVALQLSGWLAAPAWIIGGAGMGFSIGSLSVLLLDLSPEDEQGVNSSALQISDTLGSSLVVGVAGALVTGFGAARIGTGLAVAGAMFAAIAFLGVIAALRLEVRK